jgi:hypothetical protein
MLKIAPLQLIEANELVERWHRHHKPVRGHKFSIGVYKNDMFVGAAIVGRPVARMVNHKTTLEVTRLVTDGTKNACSFLYAACARIAKEMGYAKIQTYILDSEIGTSLMAAGWSLDGMTQGGSWRGGYRNNRRDDQPLCRKQRWVRILRTDDVPILEMEQNEAQQLVLLPGKREE